MAEGKGTVHRYSAACSWQGSTGIGYEGYDRSHSVTAAPAEQALVMSADAHFRGRIELLNPEQLLVMAVASCQMLSFLAVAARARLDVVEYQDFAEGLMPEDALPVRMTQIMLKPRITVRGDAREERLRQFVHMAHQQCFIANSIKANVEILPEFLFRT